MKADDLDPLASDGDDAPARAQEAAPRKVSEAKTGDVIEFVEAPIVRSGDGSWKRAPSKRAEVCFHVEGSPFVRFLVGEKRTSACWVASNALIR